MAALTTIAAVVGAAVAVGGYAEQKKAGKNAVRAAEEARIAAAADSQANQMAAENAVKRDQAAREAEANQALAAEQMDDTPQVTIDPAENAGVRRRQVQAQFNVADGGATTNAGSIRV